MPSDIPRPVPHTPAEWLEQQLTFLEGQRVEIPRVFTKARRGYRASMCAAIVSGVMAIAGVACMVWLINYGYSSWWTIPVLIFDVVLVPYNLGLYWWCEAAIASLPARQAAALETIDHIEVSVRSIAESMEKTWH